MKNTILKTIILFLLTIPFKSDAQKYRKMLGDSSVWLEVYSGLGSGTNILSIAGDTVIGGFSYKISKIVFDDSYFFLREDTQMEQIFFKRAIV